MGSSIIAGAMTHLARLLAIAMAMKASSVHAQDASEEPLEVPPSRAAERWEEPPLQYYGGLRVGVADGWDGDQEGASALGVQLGAAQVYDYFAIGPELRFTVHLDDHDFYRWTELMLKPAVGFALQKVPLRFYGACPLGIVVGARLGGYGFKMEPLLGATLFITHRIGLNMELGVGWTHLSGQDGGFRGYSVPRLNLVYGTQ
jgi:hypothetical protein